MKKLNTTFDLLFLHCISDRVAAKGVFAAARVDTRHLEWNSRTCIVDTHLPVPPVTTVVSQSTTTTTEILRIMTLID